MLSRLLADLDRDDVSGQVAESVREVERVKKAPNQEPGGWFEFIEWAKRISDESDFLKDEREYKLRIVAGLRTAKAALEEGKEDWLASLRRAFSGPNNLTPWNMHDRFLKWCESDSQMASDLLRAIWKEDSNPMRRLDAFAASVPNEVVGPALRVTLGSFLLMAERPEELTIYRETLFNRGYAATGFGGPERGALPSKVYETSLDFLDRLIEEAADGGLALRDRLDAQGALWEVISAGVHEGPYGSWPKDDLKRLLAFRGDSPANCWWVNQGKTFAVESKGSYVWAPQKNSKGSILSHWANVSKLRVDQKILHYANGQIRAVGVVLEDAVDAPRPEELPTEPWETDGRYAHVEYRILDRPIALSEIREEWRKAEANPFNSRGGVREGYMFPLNDEFCRKLEESFPSEFGGLVSGDVHGQGPPETLPALNRSWVFQANPRFFNLPGALQEISEFTWTTRQHRGDIKAGDKTYLWESGPAGGILATAMIETDPAVIPNSANSRRFELQPDEFAGEEARVLLAIRDVLTSPISRAELLDNPILSGMQILKAPQGTNFPVTEREVAELERLVGSRLADRPTIEDLARETHLPPAELGEIEALLQEKKQIIFEGPPGTGKTYVARLVAKYFTGLPLTDQRDQRVRVVQFHQSYGYEEFIQGIRPETNASGQIEYHVRPGVFKDFCAGASRNPSRNFVLIIDEINRGNISRIFGELLYLLEYRDEKVPLANSRPDEESFSIPQNVFIIGTMNTTDRSLAQIDYALRRRFYFYRLLPASEGTAPVLESWLARQYCVFARPNTSRVVRLRRMNA